LVIVPKLLIGLLICAIIVLGAAILTITPLDGIGLLVLVLLIIPLWRMAFDFLEWWNERYIITNLRVIQTTGIFNKHVIDSSLEKVNDVVLDQSVLGRLLGYGDVEILTASEAGINLLKRISNPVRFKTEMINQKEAMGQVETFEGKAQRVLSATAPTAGDVPELIAELDELRQKGIISQEEFDKKKAELLAKL
jgi:uncharacterized membrane protein YdbT with pleckstrin-like domain